MQYISAYLSPAGPMTMASDGKVLIGLWFDGQKYDRAGLDEPYIVDDTLLIFEETKKWLDAYFRGDDPGKRPPAAASGSAFRQTVWSILTEIPYGKTCTYGQLAQETADRMGKISMSAQAIGGAVGHNPLSVIVPCHRVIGSNGSLTGYAGGIEKKLWLLRHEGHDPEKEGWYVPTEGTAL